MVQDVFDKTLELSADSFFLLPGAEIVSYFPASGSSRKIKAVVFRPGAEQLGNFAGGSRAAVEVLVKNDSASGIASSEVDTGGDKIAAAPRTGERPVKMRITEILNQDAGMIRLKVI